MTERRRKKRVKRLGSRTYSGNTKNQRGAGTRGGRGKAGGHKHEYTRRQHDFGGQSAMKPNPKGNSINLWQLEEQIEHMIAKKLVKKQENKLIIDGKKIKITKILGKGNFSHKAEFVNLTFTKLAAEKLGIKQEEA